MSDFPQNEADLNELHACPWPALIEMMKRIEGDIIILGIAGKMGVTLGMLAVNAIAAAGVSKKVLGVARFSDPASRVELEVVGVECVVCDLLDRDAVAQLPQVSNVIFMAGRKFGTDGTEDLTWAMNTIVPHNVGEHFKGANIVAFSTGCVYPLVSNDSGGCDETIGVAPIGEYAQSCLGRERVFQYFAKRHATPTCLYRLNYAVDLRYGVLHDIAQQIMEGTPVNASVPYFNILWQGDANNQALLCLEHCTTPEAEVFNVTGPETLIVTDIARKLAAGLNKEVTFAGERQDLAYLSNAQKAIALFGYPTVATDTMIQMQAQWILQGGGSLGKPTHFEVNTGKF